MTSFYMKRQIPLKLVKLVNTLNTQYIKYVKYFRYPDFQKIPRNIKVPLLLHYLPRQTH